jgi:hypothetical protein
MLLCRIKRLSLRNNNLTGTLPSGWAAPADPSYTIDLDLGLNQLTGTLPDSWSTGLPLGSYLYLDNNMLTGEWCRAGGRTPILLQTQTFHCLVLCCKLPGVLSNPTASSTAQQPKVYVWRSLLNQDVAGCVCCLCRDASQQLGCHCTRQEHRACAEQQHAAW